MWHFKLPPEEPGVSLWNKQIQKFEKFPLVPAYMKYQNLHFAEPLISAVEYYKVKKQLHPIETANLYTIIL